MTPLRRHLYGTTVLAKEPITVGNAILSAVGITATSTFVIAAVGYVAITLVTSWVLSALTPKPDFGALDSRSLMVNARDAVASHDFVYGQIRKGGAITYYESTGTNNKFLHQIIVLAGHEVEEIGDIYINDEIVTVDTNGFVTSAPWNSKIRINTHDGSQTTADADLLAESNQITAAFVGNGIAYLYVRMEYDQDVFANGIPLITAVVKGKKVYDPRTTTTAYSANAALCIRDYLTSAYGLNDSEIDDTVFSAAANVCDENVTLDVGGTEKRYTLNGVIRGDTSHGDVLTRMMTSCAGTLFWGAGKWKLVAGDYTAPTKTLTLDDLRGPINLDTRVNLRDQFNKVQGTFNDAAQRWITADYPPITSSVFETEDNGVQSALDFELPFTTSSATAQRLAKLTLFRGREQMTLSADFGLNAFDVEVGEIIALTIERYGWTAKEFEVIGWNFGPNQDAGDLRISLTLRETSSSAFDWNAEESAILANNTTLLSYADVPTVGIPAEDIQSTIRIVREKITEVISINITSANSESVDRVEVQFQGESATEWKGLGSGPLGRYDLVDPEPGNYRFRARAINPFGYKGGWTTSGLVQTAGSATPPSDVTGLFYEISEGTTTLEWEPVSDLDLSFYRIRHAVETSGATWANATTAVDKVPRPGTSVALPTRPGTYLIKAYDKTAIPSTNAESVIIAADDVPSFTNTLTQTEDPGFSGSKTDCEVVTGDELRIIFDSAAPYEGTYDFSTYIETHDSTARRVRARIDANVVRVDESAGLFDDLPGLFDELPGLFDDLTGAAQFADTNLLFYISTTNDDPAGSPTWSAYKQFRAGEFYGRAFRFRVVLKSTSENVTPSITGLEAVVEYN